MKFEDLSASQRAVVLATQKLVLAIGGPGTGKTIAALWAGRHMLEQASTQKWQRVLFLTFSRTAVSQLEQRAIGVFRNPGDQRIDVMTFDGFAYQMLRSLGRYASYGPTLPEIQSESHKIILGQDAHSLTYAQLVPAATQLLDSERVRGMVADRWPLLICDEFQDTDDTKWTLLERLRKRARLVLLADPDQMIYGWLGVPKDRLDKAEKLADVTVPFEKKSFRDPSGAIPAMAAAVLKRDFSNEAVLAAAKTHRLRVVTNVTDETLMAVLDKEMKSAQGCKSVAIFCRSNLGVARLSQELWNENVDHAIIGLPEADGEGLVTLATVCKFVVGQASSDELDRALAVYCQACVRDQQPHPVAKALKSKFAAQGNPHLLGVRVRLEELKSKLLNENYDSMEDVILAVCKSWPYLKARVGDQQWRRISADFSRLARPFYEQPATGETVRKIERVMNERRPNAFFEIGTRAPDGLVQIMNFAQTKGREADLVFLLYRPTDRLGPRQGPFTESSRSLYVALTRARRRAVVLLPTNPHPLVSPLERFSVFTLASENERSKLLG